MKVEIQYDKLFDLERDPKANTLLQASSRYTLGKVFY